MALLLVSRPAMGQRVLSWADIRDQFEAANPTLEAGRIGIGQSRAQVDHGGGLADTTLLVGDRDRLGHRRWSLA